MEQIVGGTLVILILEGANYVGKSYVANRLKKSYFPAYKQFRSLGVEKTEYYKGIKKNGSDFLLYDFLAQLGQKVNFINDRSFFGFLFFLSLEI